MTEFEPGSSGIRSDRSANCTNTTAQLKILLIHLVYLLCDISLVDNKISECSRVLSCGLEGYGPIKGSYTFHTYSSKVYGAA